MGEPNSSVELMNSPNRMSTRTIQRVNYAELNTSGSIGFSSNGGSYSDQTSNIDTNPDDGLFRSPSASTRGRKRRLIHDDTMSMLSMSAPKRGRPRGSGISTRGRGSSRRPVIGTDHVAEVEERGLFGAAKSGKNLDTTIDEWIEEYERHPDAALVKLQQFFISCCGCKGVISAQMIATLEYSDIIRRMTEDFDEDSGDYPLVMSGTQWKKFRNNLHSMLYVLIDKCKSSLIFDQRMMDSVIQLLTGLADSQVRAFRHTATFAAMKISSALVDVTIELVSVKDRNSKQIEAEKARLKQISGTNEKLDVLIQKKNEMPDVRLKCITALLPLYDKQDVLAKLELFTNKFKDRLVSMVLDRDNEVAMKACQLMTSIYRVFPSILQLKDCVPIYELVYSNHRGLAVAAGEFLNTKVFQHAQRNRACSVMSSGSRGGMGDSAALIKDLIQFYIEGECHDHASYLVDALIDTNPMMKDWQTMIDLLMSDDGLGFKRFMIFLFEYFISLVLVFYIFHNNKYLNFFQFIADRDKVANLITLPLSFQLDMYMAGRLENHLTDLMRVLDMVVEKHTDEEMLNTVAEVITYFSTNTAVAQHTETYRLKLIDGLALQLRHTVQRFMNEDQWDDEDEAAMLASFRKITAFSRYTYKPYFVPLITYITTYYSHIDLKKWDLWEVVLHVLTNHDEKAPRDVVDKSIWFLFMQLNWDLLRLVRDQEPNKNVMEAVKKLKKRRDQFLHNINGILTEGASGVELGFQCLSDSLIMFNEELKEQGSYMEPLIVRLDNDFITKMQTFVNDNVFTEAGNDTQLEQQQQVELMHKKRGLLSQYCKMVLHGVFPIHDASVVLKHYCAFYTDFGDILKQLLYKCRDLNFVACAKAVTKALVDVYENIRFSTGLEYVDPLSDAFQQLRDLAKRFSVAFGNDHIKNREAVAMVHRDGIQFALQGFDPNLGRRGGNKPANITFLEVIMEFSSKLIRQDKQAVTRYLEKHGGTSTISSKDSTWEPYLLYRNSLSDRHPDDVSSVRSFSTSYTSRGRGRGRGRGGGRSTPTPSEINE
uniref:STAG domain-containing protein n=1 Tax=Heterorhabditis bacteriophora TaxID=37862 RepID=A0A1I7XVF4_HETBA